MELFKQSEKDRQRFSEQLSQAISKIDIMNNDLNNLNSNKKLFSISYDIL